MRPIQGTLGLAIAGWHRLPRAARLLGPFAVMAVLWWTSSRSPDHGASSVLKSWLSNGAHVIAFGGLAGAWLMVFVQRVDDGLRLFPRHAAVAMVLTVAYGIFDEVHQSYVPDRDSSVVDVVTDGIGGGIAVVLVGWALRRGSRLPRAFVWLLLLAMANVSLATWSPW